MENDREEAGKALNAAAALEFDEVIDPKDTRKWISNALTSLPPISPEQTREHRFIDSW